MSEKPDRPYAGNRAFTRMDLLALLASLTLLLFIVLPALGRVSGKTIIAQCAANLEQYDMALQIYGGENQDNLPSISGSVNWAWDAPTSYLALITNTGVKWTSLYCPGTSARFTEQDNWFLWNYEPGVFGVLGYATTVPGVASMQGTTLGTYSFATNVNATLTMQRIAYNFGYFPVQPGSRPLVADATLMLNNGVPPPAGPALNAAMLTYNWFYIYGGYFIPHLSPHLNGLIPLGGNVGMLDGHVEWRNLTNMLPRAGDGTSGAPCFFW
jgi:prepilin-type processing-associated H-X9-DG protein